MFINTLQVPGHGDSPHKRGTRTCGATVHFRLLNSFLEWRSVFSSEEAFSRVEKHSLEWRSVFASGETFSRVKKRLHSRKRSFTGKSASSLPVPRLGFPAKFWAGSGRIPSASGPKIDPKAPGPRARAVWGRSVRNWRGAKACPKPVPEARSGDRRHYQAT